MKSKDWGEGGFNWLSSFKGKSQESKATPPFNLERYLECKKLRVQTTWNLGPRPSQWWRLQRSDQWCKPSPSPESLPTAWAGLYCPHYHPPRHSPPQVCQCSSSPTSPSTAGPPQLSLSLVCSSPGNCQTLWAGCNFSPGSPQPSRQVAVLATKHHRLPSSPWKSKSKSSLKKILPHKTTWRTRCHQRAQGRPLEDRGRRGRQPARSTWCGTRQDLVYWW